MIWDSRKEMFPTGDNFGGNNVRGNVRQKGKFATGRRILTRKLQTGFLILSYSFLQLLTDWDSVENILVYTQ